MYESAAAATNAGASHGGVLLVFLLRQEWESSKRAWAEQPGFFRPFVPSPTTKITMIICITTQQPARFPQRRQTPVRKVPIPTSSPALEQPSVSASAPPSPQVAEEETDKKSAGFPTATDSMDDHVADELLSPTSLTYTGDAVIPITSVLEIIKPQDDTPRGVWPVFRLMVRLR